MGNINDMTVGSPTRDIIKFALPLICGYILQQMYLIIDAAIVGRWIGGRTRSRGCVVVHHVSDYGVLQRFVRRIRHPVARSFGAKDFFGYALVCEQCAPHIRRHRRGDNRFHLHLLR